MVKHSCFVFGWAWVQISARRLAVSAAVFVVFLSPSWQMLESYLTLGHDFYHPHLFQFIIQ
jgi:hypothetical protein